VAGGVHGGHADLEAFEVGKRLERSVRADSEHDAGKPAELDRGADVLSHGLRAQRMLVRAYCDIDQAVEQGIERFPAAGEIGHCDGQSVVTEVAAPFRDRHRQIIEMRLVGDSELERGAFKLLPLADRDWAQQQACQTRGESPAVVVQFYHRTTEGLQCSARLALFRPSWQSETPAMPNAPDIDQPYALVA